MAENTDPDPSGTRFPARRHAVEETAPGKYRIDEGIRSKSADRIGDLIVLVPVSFLILGIFRIMDLAFEETVPDFIHPWLFLYFAAWMIAWAVVDRFLAIPAIRARGYSRFARHFSIILLFWPMVALANPVAEKLSIIYRTAAWRQAADAGSPDIYNDTPGIHWLDGWGGLPAGIDGFTFAALATALVWLPALALSELFLWLVSREHKRRGR